MFHLGYYNDKSNTIFIQAQLFCAPTEYSDVLRLPRSIMKGEGNNITRRHLDESTLVELRNDLINNWDIHYSNPNLLTMQKPFWWSCGQKEQQADLQEHFTQVPLLKNLVDTFETIFPYLSVDLVWLLCKSKEGDGFQGRHKDFLLGQRIIKTTVVNVGSKERDNEETTESFGNDVSFEVDDWKAIEECALGLGGLNLEDKLHQDEQKAAAIPTKDPPVT
jgi:hypothetical protein